MNFKIITLFPNMFNGPFVESIIFRAKERKLIDINIHQLRDYALDKHKTVDDTPCGGGPGMVLKVDVVDKAITDIKKTLSTQEPRNLRTILLTPKGEKFTQKKALELSKYDNLILVCGHYEGFDQRVHDQLVDEQISIGDYVVTGGEIPAMVLVDAITRLLPGVIRRESLKSESFTPPAQDTRIKTQTNSNLQILNKNSNITIEQYSSNSMSFDYPVYTRPIEYKGWKVPEVLLSGDHKKIDEWRGNQR